MNTQNYYLRSILESGYGEAVQPEIIASCSNLKSGDVYVGFKNRDEKFVSQGKHKMDGSTVEDLDHFIPPNCVTTRYAEDDVMWFDGKFRWGHDDVPEVEINLPAVLVHPDLAKSLKPGEWFEAVEGYEHKTIAKGKWLVSNKQDYDYLDDEHRRKVLFKQEEDDPSKIQEWQKYDGLWTDEFADK